MRISYSNYPILEKLKDGKLGVLPVSEYDFKNYVWLEKLTNNFKTYHNRFSSEIYHISTAFSQAAIKSYASLKGVLQDFLDNKLGPLNFSGTYITGKYVHMISFNKDDNGTESVYCVFSNDGIPVGYMIDNEVENIKWVTSILHPKTMSPQEFINHEYLLIIILYLFKLYAKVEDVELAPRTNKKDFGCKYSNDIDNKIHFLDSRWFTTLIQSEGFNVRGHFRLQPKKKDGKWTKEIIWINEFKKHGYTSKAKILNQL